MIMDEAILDGYTLSDIRDLIDNTQDMINKLDEHRNWMSPLMTEVYNGNYETVSLLLQYEYIDINIRNTYGHSAYFYCLNPREYVSEESKLRCLKLLLKAGVQNIYRVHEGHNFTPLMIVAKQCDDVCLNEIIKAGYSNNGSIDLDFDLDSEDEILLENDNYLEYFHDCYYDIGDEDELDDNTCIEDCTSTNNIEKRKVDFYTYCHVYKKRWKTSIDLWDFGNRKTAFQLCLEARDILVEKQLACLRLLIEAGASYLTHVDEYQLRPITVAIGKYSAVDLSVIKYLLSIGCYLDQQKDFKRAVCYMHVEIAQLLIKEGCDPHLLSTNNRNILHTFFMWDNLSFFEHEGVYEKMKNMLRYIVQDLKIDINAVDDCGVSIFSLVFIYFAKGIPFPFLYLISENINLNILTTDRELQVYHAMFRTARVFALSFKEVDYYKLLYDMGISLDLNCLLHDRFLGKNEPNKSTLKWFEDISSRPDSLIRSCKFTVRKLLGKDIKSKISQLKVPNVLKRMILLKDILPEECFEY